MRDSSHEADGTSVDDRKAVLLSISDILKESRSSSASPWHLALVQRERVWTPFEAAMLLDSLLKGYPIGSFLLCQAKNTKIHKLTDRSVSDAEDHDWQVIDGQQRLWAIGAIFGGNGSDADPTPEFFLKIGSKRPELDPSKKRDERLRRWITWTEGDQDLSVEHGFGRDTRADWLSIKKVGKAFYAESPFSASQLLTLDSADIDEWLSKVDEDYQGPSPSTNEEVLNWIIALSRAWCDKTIPVQRVSLSSSEDVYEAFTRINMQGITTKAPDVFFAAVKTVWNETEECLDNIRRVASDALSRMDILRFVARTAAYDLGFGDPIPLHPKRLSGDRGRILVVRMEEFSKNKETIARIHHAVSHLISDSFLGYAWWYIDPYLIDDVLAWAVKSPELPTHDHMHIASGYLFWGTALRLRPILRNRYAKASFKVCIEGSKEFSLEEVLQKGIDDLKSGRALMLPRPFDANEPSEEKRDVVNRSGRLFLSIAQGLSFKLPDGKRVDWDHILAEALRRNLKMKKPGKRKKEFHEHSYYIWHAGNLCALDSKLNRQLQDDRPKIKFSKTGGFRAEGKLWPEDLYLSEEEKERFLAIDDLLDRDGGLATKYLKEVVESREDRLWFKAVCRYRQVYEVLESLFRQSEIQ